MGKIKLSYDPSLRNSKVKPRAALGGSMGVDDGPVKFGSIARALQTDDSGNPKGGPQKVDVMTVAEGGEKVLTRVTPKSGGKTYVGG